VLAIIIPTLQLIIIRRQALIQIKTEEGRKEGRKEGGGGGGEEKKKEAEWDDDGGDDVLHCCLPTPPVPRQIFSQDEEGEVVL
jgi:hypothetical protein